MVNFFFLPFLVWADTAAYRTFIVARRLLSSHLNQSPILIRDLLVYPIFENLFES